MKNTQNKKGTKPVRQTRAKCQSYLVKTFNNGSVHIKPLTNKPKKII